jgi:hypothetical protein
MRARCINAHKSSDILVMGEFYEVKKHTLGEYFVTTIDGVENAWPSDRFELFRVKLLPTSRAMSVPRDTLLSVHSVHITGEYKIVGHGNLLFLPSEFEIVPELKVKCINEGTGTFVKEGQIYSAWHHPFRKDNYTINRVGQSEDYFSRHRFEVVQFSSGSTHSPSDILSNDKHEPVDHEELRLRKILTTRAVAPNMCVHCDVPLSVCVYHR